MSPQSHALRGEISPKLAGTERSRLRAFAFLGPQSGLAVGCFDEVKSRAIRGVRAGAVCNPHLFKASLGPEWAALKKHASLEAMSRRLSEPALQGAGPFGANDA